MRRNNEFNKWLVYLLIVIYATCYQLQQPIEPFLVDKLVKQQGAEGSDATVVYGQIQSFFGVAQALGSLAIGAVIDRLGTRAGFMISFLSCACSYYLLSITDSVNMLYLTKVALPGTTVVPTSPSVVSPLHLSFSARPLGPRCLCRWLLVCADRDCQGDERRRGPDHRAGPPHHRLHYRCAPLQEDFSPSHAHPCGPHRCRWNWGTVPRRDPRRQGGLFSR